MTDILTSPAVQDAVDHVEGSQPIRPAVLRAAQLAHERKTMPATVSMSKAS